MKIKDIYTITNNVEYCVVIRNKEQYNSLLDYLLDVNKFWNKSTVDRFRGNNYLLTELQKYGEVAVCIHNAQWCDVQWYIDNWQLKPVEFGDIFDYNSDKIIKF